MIGECRDEGVISEYRNVVLLRLNVRWSENDEECSMANVRKYRLFNNQLVVSLLNDTKISFIL